ncbi:MAG: 4Fe-4S binding protein [bacterium]|nr:4Fe-4S binding protein [bacterium]
MQRLKRFVLSLALWLLSAAILADWYSGWEHLGLWVGQASAAALTVGIVLAVLAALLLLSLLDRGRTDAWLRLDWFLPALRRLARQEEASHSAVGRGMRRILPPSWQSDWQTKRRGGFRRLLRKLGVSWVASPVRRVIQTVCLLLFLTLFFYVCWPYSARPGTDPIASENWSLSEFDQQTGTVALTRVGNNSASLDPAGDPPSVVYVYQGDRAEEAVVERFAGRFQVEQRRPDRIQLVPLEAGSLDPLDAFLAYQGQFVLYDQDPHAWPDHYARNLAAKERVPAELFLAIDPLVSLSTAVAARSWVWSLMSAAVILLVCVLIPRGFCGYLCPLGTTIDFFDWAVAGRVQRFRVPGDGWWVHIKYYLLAAIMICAACGVLISGMFSAIPVITRALLFLFDPLQSGIARGWHLVPAMHAGHWLSIGMFFVVLGLGFLRPRFWCKYVCPSGAVFSLANVFRLSERKVESSCIHCNKCIEICPFDAIKPDFTTRTTDCTLCQSCGGVCPTHAIKFVERWNVVELKVENDPPTQETSLGRRGFLSLAAGTAAAAAGGLTAAAGISASGARLDTAEPFYPVRPPGSVPEREFLQMCIRCGECFKACPNNVLQAEGFEQGLEGLWAPMVQADWAGCESSCNACGQVCPTGAIRALTLEEKRVARMGLAVVNESTCLPFADAEDCDLCVQECIAAGYEAIEYIQVGTEVDAQGQPIEGSGRLAPWVLADKCVGCGLCQTRCVAINVKEKHVLQRSAIIVEAGPGKEDRLMRGSYRELRQAENNAKAHVPTDRGPSETATSPFSEPVESDIEPMPESNPFQLQPESTERSESEDDPFGISN